jgi:hypothetical protein
MQRPSEIDPAARTEMSLKRMATVRAHGLAGPCRLPRIRGPVPARPAMPAGDGAGWRKRAVTAGRRQPVPMLRSRRRLAGMAKTDRELDAKSRKLLGEMEHLRQLEQEKRASSRSTDEFHRLAEEVDAAAGTVFRIAHDQMVEGRDDSPIPAEEAEQEPGDWTSHATH